MSEQDRMAEEREARAGEYVIGTMPADEREAFERELPSVPALQAAVRAWEERLADLVSLVPDQTPDPAVWAALERALERKTQRESASTAAPEYLSAAAMAGSLLPLRRSRARWRGAAAAMTALAAGLALFVTSTVWRDKGTSYLAVINRGGDLPALVVEVDTGAGVVHVRSLAAETPTGRSLELWLIAPGGTPRSLGLVDQPRRDRAMPAAAKGGDLAGATLAVSVEPKGGSTTGGPTGPVIYSGKLLPEEP